MTLVIVSLLAAFADAPDDPAEAFATARAVIEQQEAAIRSFDVEFELVKIFGGGPPPADKLEIQRNFVREQRRGDRYRRDFDMAMDGDVPTGANRDIQSFDGSTWFLHGEISKTGLKSRNGTEPDCIRHALYFSRFPPTGLGNQFAAYKDDADVAWETVDGERLLAVSWDENQDQGTTRRTFFLDPQAAWQPRRYTSASEYGDGRKGRKQLAEVQDYVRQDGFVWPKVVLRTFYEVDAEIRERRTMNLLTIKTVAFNVELDDAVFKIDFPEGTRVTDYDQSVEYVVGEPDSERPHVDANMLPPPPPPYQPWADWRLWLAAAAICGGLFIGVLIRRKRKATV